MQNIAQIISMSVLGRIKWRLTMYGSLTIRTTQLEYILKFEQDKQERYPVFKSLIKFNKICSK